MKLPTQFDGEDIHIALGERTYRVRGLARNTSFDIMKVNIRITVLDSPPTPHSTSNSQLETSNSKGAAGLFHVDTLDLYNARHRKAFIHAAADECRLDAEVIQRDIGRVLLKLEELQEANLAEIAEPEKPAIELTDAEQAEALELLRAPDLLDRIAADFELAGLVGESANALVAYLAAVSRKTLDPLAVIIQSSSSAGKSSLMDAVLSLMPDEEQIRYTAMTGQSLFYMGETELQHKILAIAEEEGAEQAGYALKILQSEKRLRIASTGKDPKTGRLVTQEYLVEGPCAIFMTTTNIEVDEELQNRCIILTVNENRDQTRRIHALQRTARTLVGLLRGEDKKRVLRVHRNAQRLLRPLQVVNPYAEQLTFADTRLRTRRDHMKYLNLINAVALLHQYQREVKTVNHQGKKLQYIEVTLSDIEAANRLTADVMGASLDDLPPQTRKLLMSLRTLTREICEERQLELQDLRLTRRQIREYTGWGNTQLGIHLERLVDHEYLAAYRAERGRTLVYELLYHGEGHDGRRFMLNLIELDRLQPGPAPSAHDYDSRSTGVKPRNTGGVRPEYAPDTPPAESPKTADPGKESTVSAPESAQTPETHVAGHNKLQVGSCKFQAAPTNDNQRSTSNSQLPTLPKAAS